MTTLSMAATDTINDEIRRTFGEAAHRIDEAREAAGHLQTVAESMAEDVPQLSRWSSGRMVVQNLLVVELGQLHPFELQSLATILARAIARKDPSRTDGRFSENVQKLADPFRS